MNWKHLLWIIPVILILGLRLGFVFGMTASHLLNETISDVEQCSVNTLTYVAEHNSDCQILISGYLRNCTNNIKPLKPR